MQVCTAYREICKNQMIPYYSPHFGFLDLIKTIFCFNAEAMLAERFRELTGKKYILFTSSCRSALYLAYKAIGKKGTVHTSPLTCKVALLPILASENKICFHDVKQNDWTLDPTAVERGITEESTAIQAIHFGGFPCDMPALRRIADDYHLVLIEDCAQGYGSSYNGVGCGQLGDISCFTLTKNLYSLGGGVFATNNKEWYLKAKWLQQGFRKEKWVKIIYRVVLAVLTTYRTKLGCERLYQFIKGNLRNTDADDEQRLLKKELTKPAKLYLKSCAARWGKIQTLVDQRKVSAKSLLRELRVSDEDRQYNTLSDSSFTKLFIRSAEDSRKRIEDLNKHGIEAMHLEHKHRIYYQEKLLYYEDSNTQHKEMLLYESMHDRIVSLPASECSSNYERKEFMRFLGDNQ